MYEPGTILKKKEQQPPDPETGTPFPYNRVVVINSSPVSHARGDWEGADAQGVIIQPLESFGGNLDEPFGKVREMFEVESVPVVEIPAQQVIRVVNATSAQAGPTPEEVFAAEAPGKAPEDGQKRARTNPLGEPGGPASADGPLGKAPSRRKAVK